MVEVQKVFQVLEVMQQQEDQVEVVKDIQLVRPLVQKLERQETLLQQLLLKEMLVEMEFTPLVLEVLKLPLEVVVLEHVEQMLHNQVVQTVTLVLVVMEFPSHDPPSRHQNQVSVHQHHHHFLDQKFLHQRVLLN